MYIMSINIIIFYKNNKHSFLWKRTLETYYSWRRDMSWHLRARSSPQHSGALKLELYQYTAINLTVNSSLKYFWTVLLFLTHIFCLDDTYDNFSREAICIEDLCDSS